MLGENHSKIMANMTSLGAREILIPVSAGFWRWF